MNDCRIKTQARAIFTSTLVALSLCATFGLAPLCRAETPTATGPAAQEQALAQFHQIISPILEENCYDCHADGKKKGGMAFDELTSKEQILQNPELWLKVLRNTRSHLMPPEDPVLTAAQQNTLEQWITTSGFGLDPTRPDPGRVTVRRLNRAEYRNTIRDLMGIDFDADNALAADDIGYGFDNIGDVLTLSPMRMEKFLAAAQRIVQRSVPAAPRAMSEEYSIGKDFLTADGKQNGDTITFYQTRKVRRTYHVPVAGDYRIVIATSVDGQGTPDPGRCRVTGTSDTKEFFAQDYAWHDCQFFSEQRTVHWEAGEHTMEFNLTPAQPPQEKHPKLDFKLVTVEVHGPLDPKAWLPSPNYARFFPRALPPTGKAERRKYAREVLTRFATKAYRRPVSSATIERLVNLAESGYETPGTSFELGVAPALVAILASPRFIFRLEQSAPDPTGQPFVNVDEYALASRLSYFLWSSMPDDELYKLAASGTLRKNLSAQVQRMLADPKASALVENFAGQWLQSRAISNIALDRPLILGREGIKVLEPSRTNPLPSELTADQREAMKREAEAYFSHVVHADRTVLELIDSDYTFLNATLAKYYGFPAGTAPDAEFVKVILPPNDPRGGGVLTMASTLAVTSNPTRTSPVKRGKWILENILGAPAPPPPPNIPSLEDTEKQLSDHKPTQREVLAIHRKEALCASCHARMDPLGLALENFNALGLYRTAELGQPVDATGELFTGESFKNIRELKHILATNHHQEIYRTLTEKLLTYALGRGVEYYDVPTMDHIVGRLERGGGRFSELLMGIIESAPFQQRRAAEDSQNSGDKSATHLTQATPAHESEIH